MELIDVWLEGLQLCSLAKPPLLIPLAGNQDRPVLHVVPEPSAGV